MKIKAKVTSQESQDITFVQKASGLVLHTPWKCRKNCWRSPVCIVVLCLIPVLLFPTVVFGKQVWTVGDLGNYNFPLHVAVLRQWRSGTVPLWNPYVTSGTPLAASMQGGVFYPPNWFLILLSDGSGFTFSILAHIALTGVFTFAYLRTIQLSRWASLVGALIFQISGFVMSHLGHVAMLRTIPWLPLIMLTLQKWSDRGDWQWVCFGALAMGCSILAGYPQTSAYSAMTALAYLIFLFFQADHRRWRLLGGGIALFILAAGVASVQIALTSATWNEYMRPDNASFEYFSWYSFHPSYVIRLIIPPLPRGEMVGYVGVPTLLLIASSLLVKHSRRKEELVGFYAAIAVVSLLLAFGSYTVLADWTYHIPIYNSFSVISRHLLEFDFGLAVLAAFGLDVLQKFISDRQPEWISKRQGTIRGAICIVLLIGWIVLWVSAGIGIPGNDSPALVWNNQVAQGLVRAIVLALMTVGIIWLARRVKRFALAPALLLLLLFIDLSGATGRIYTPHLHSFDEMAVPSDISAFLKQEREPYRVMSFVLHGSDFFIADARRSKWLLPNFHMLASIESAAGYDAVMLAQLDEITNHTLPPNGLVEVQALYNASWV